jgi:hypothetical protein
VAGTIRQIPVSESKVTSVEGGFGTLEESKTRTIRELVINFGTPAKDADESFSKEEIAQGLTERKARLEANKIKQETKAAAVAAAPEKPKGFEF